MKPYELTFELPGLPATINSMGRRHWSVKAREAREWRRAVLWVVGSKRPSKPLQWAQITYTRFSSIEMDHDNLAGSFKHVQDGLVDAGVIVNDKMANIGSPTYLWDKAKNKQGFIRVTVREMLTPWQGPGKPSDWRDGQSPTQDTPREDPGSERPDRGSCPRTRRAFEQFCGAGASLRRADRRSSGDSKQAVPLSHGSRSRLGLHPSRRAHRKPAALNQSLLAPHSLGYPDLNPTGDSPMATATKKKPLKTKTARTGTKARAKALTARRTSSKSASVSARKSG